MIHLCFMEQGNTELHIFILRILEKHVEKFFIELKFSTS